MCDVCDVCFIVKVGLDETDIVVLQRVDRCGLEVGDVDEEVLIFLYVCDTVVE